MSAYTCETCGIGCCPGKHQGAAGWCPNWRTPAEVQHDLERLEALRWKMKAQDTGQGPVP